MNRPNAAAIPLTDGVGDTLVQGGAGALHQSGDPVAAQAVENLRQQQASGLPISMSFGCWPC
jgi:hypothetical protein